MKKCPACNREYADEVRFCLEDGMTLVRAGESNQATMTMPAAPEFRPPPSPTLAMPTTPSMSVGRTLLNIFVAPARAFASFRDVTTFTPAAVRFLVAAPIIVAAMVAYNVIYPALIGSGNIARAAIEATPRMSNLPPETKERALQMTQNPTFHVITAVMGFGRLVLILLASLPLGALIYWLGAMACKAPLKYMQALLVWTYATLPPAVLWFIANVITLFVSPPTTNVGIATGAAGVLPSSLGSLLTIFTVTTLPLPVYVVALSAIDGFEFYGLTLAAVGLRKTGKLPWIGALVTVAAVWTVGLVWRIATGTLVNVISR
jgi:hypothetical protein